MPQCHSLIMQCSSQQRCVWVFSDRYRRGSRDVSVERGNQVRDEDKSIGAHLSDTESPSGDQIRTLTVNTPSCLE